MEQEKWINEILDSTEQIMSVAPSDTLYLKIKQQITTQNTVSPRFIGLAAASIIVLMVLNVKIVF